MSIARERLQKPAKVFLKFIRVPTHRQATLQGGFSRLIATTDFVILNLSHTDTLLKFKHMVFISNPYSV